MASLRCVLIFPNRCNSSTCLRIQAIRNRYVTVPSTIHDPPLSFLMSVGVLSILRHLSCLRNVPQTSSSPHTPTMTRYSLFLSSPQRQDSSKKYVLHETRRRSPHTPAMCSIIVSGIEYMRTRIRLLASSWKQYSSQRASEQPCILL